MTSYQIKKLTMFLAIQNLIVTTNASILAQMPHFNEIFDKFKDFVALLLQQSIIQSQPISGYKELKTNVQNNMIDQAFAISVNIIAFVEITNNIVLKNSVNYPLSTLYKIPEIACIDACRNISKVAHDNLNDLTDYNVTTTTIDALNAAIDNFSALFPLPKDHINIKKMATNDIKETTTLASTQLDITDALVKMLLTTQPEFTNRYFSLRRIQQPAYSKLALKVNITDPNKNPLGKVKITCPTLTFTKPKYTTQLGNFQLKHIPSEVYAFTFTKPGYQTLTTNIPITAGERTQLKLTLTPNP